MKPICELNCWLQNSHRNALSTLSVKSFSIISGCTIYSHLFTLIISGCTIYSHLFSLSYQVALSTLTFFTYHIRLHYLLSPFFLSYQVALSTLTFLHLSYQVALSTLTFFHLSYQVALSTLTFFTIISGCTIYSQLFSLIVSGCTIYSQLFHCKVRIVYNSDVCANLLVTLNWRFQI